MRTQVAIDVDDGLKHASSIHCDVLASLSKSMLTHFVGRLTKEKLAHLDRALAAALDLELMLLSPEAMIQ